MEGPILRNPRAVEGFIQLILLVEQKPAKGEWYCHLLVYQIVFDRGTSCKDQIHILLAPVVGKARGSTCERDVIYVVVGQGRDSNRMNTSYS